jgi:hypothetical protein
VTTPTLEVSPVKEIILPFRLSIVLTQTDVHWVEAQFLEQRTKLFLEALQQVLAHIEGEVVPQATACTRCGGRLVHNGRVPMVLETLLGRVEYARQRLRCRGCGADVYPLDEALGLLSGSGSTLGVRERALWAAVEVSYAKAGEFLEKFAGLAISHGSVHRWAQDEGSVLEMRERGAQEAMFGAHPTWSAERPPGPGRLYVQIDGTMVHARPAGEMECRVGIVDSARAAVSRGRIALLDKQTDASFEDAATFGERFWVRCAAVEAQQIVFVSDGAPWIHTLQRAYFPGALVVLDPWHLIRQIQWAWGAESRELVTRCLADAWQGDVKSLTRRLTARLGQERDPERRARGAGLLGYVNANAEGIANLGRLEATGSGAAEKTVDTLVVRRYKKRGMSWSRRGSGSLLRLRLLKANGQWDSYWAWRREAFARRVA